MFFTVAALSYGLWIHKPKGKVKTVEVFNTPTVKAAKNFLGEFTRKPVTEVDGVQLTDEEVDARIRESFEVLDHLNKMVSQNKMRSLIVVGPAGLGKSYGLEKILESADPTGERTEIIKGYIRPTGLYRKLYDNRHKNSVVVFDDADSVFNDETSLNLLKAVLDTTDKRVVSYLTERNMKDENGDVIPKTFEFEATVVFISNLDFDALIEKEHRLAPHFEALLSRSHYIDLDMKTKQDYIVRIRQVMALGLLSSKGYDKKVENDIMQFIETYAERIRELSLRAVIKLAELRSGQPDKWKRLALKTMCKR